MPPLNAKVADTAPDEPTLTPYDEQHAVTYVRLLDAEKLMLTGEKSRVLFFISIRSRSLIVLAVPTIVI